MSSGSTTSGASNAPPVAAVTGAPRNVRDALNMLHQNKQDSAAGSAYVTNHYHSSGRSNESDVNGTGGGVAANKKYSGIGSSSDYSQGPPTNKVSS